ncbi:MAG TPA: glucosidase, partial [Lacipirellulaceae bacterium]|nr:glucosidase [Lacipirellulaceae bacterium]
MSIASSKTLAESSAPAVPLDGVAALTAEELRVQHAHERSANWQRWGSYLAERQWATVREDYSEFGDCWDYFPHDHARSRAYRWGEDGLLGICDRECRLCFALALWNGNDPILKERLFGLTGPQGNHGEDVKECYYYLDATPTHSYTKSLYKYPQQAYPYDRLVEENGRRTKADTEFELADTGVFDAGRYFDIAAEYAKASPDDILVRITASNRGPDAATLHLLPTLWFRNTWSWGCTHEGCEVKPRIEAGGKQGVICRHATLGAFRMIAESDDPAHPPHLLFTDNETNTQRLFGIPNSSPHVKDAFHDFVIDGREDTISEYQVGTKAAWHYVLNMPAGSEKVVRLRLTSEAEADGKGFGEEFDDVFARRSREANEFYTAHLPAQEHLTLAERAVARQAYAGLLQSKQFYHLAVKDWLQGDPEQPPPPIARQNGRNHDWPNLFNRDVISMPDKWEYPWYAAWDLAFHMLPMARVDGEFAKKQLLLFLREWYMHPNGQIPAYEFAFGDVNPPVHAWACWRVYKMTAARGCRDRLFLRRAFHKLLLNFTWWVNRKDPNGRNLFAGGFLGLDNIGVFDRSKPLPMGGHLEQADGTAWMAFYCSIMLSIALELAAEDPSYEDIASKFFEHFIAIIDAMNCLGGMGLWDEQDGFYYDVLNANGTTLPLRIRSMVGIIPLFAAEVLQQDVIDRLPDFKKRLEWFIKHRPDLARHISYCTTDTTKHNGQAHTHRLLAVPSRERLTRVLRYVLDESEFLSPNGIRSLSRYYQDHPFVIQIGGEEHCVGYVPGESNTGLFGGNSNWRGPVWFPVNYLLIEALERYYHFYGESLRVECPTGSGRVMNLKEVAHELTVRLTRIFLPDKTGRRPCHGNDT